MPKTAEQLSRLTTLSMSRYDNLLGHFLRLAMSDADDVTLAKARIDLHDELDIFLDLNQQVADHIQKS